MYTDDIGSVILGEIANYAELISGIKATNKRSESTKNRISPTDIVNYSMQLMQDGRDFVNRIAR